MYRFILGFLALVATTRAFAFERVELIYGDADFCAPVMDDFTNKLDADIDGFPTHFVAGAPLHFEMSLNKKFSLSVADWKKDYSSVTVQLRAVAPVRKTIDLRASSDFFDFLVSGDQTRQVSLSRDIGVNVGASFKLDMIVALVTETADYCMLDVQFGNAITIDSDKPDLDPPFLRSMSFDKQTYAPGEEAVVRFGFSEPLFAPESDHIEFINSAIPERDETRGFPGYHAGEVYHLEALSDGVYALKFQVPAAAKPGNYVLKFFNRRDIFDNFAAEVGGIDEVEKRLASSVPLIVK